MIGDREAVMLLAIAVILIAVVGMRATVSDAHVAKRVRILEARVHTLEALANE